MRLDLLLGNRVELAITNGSPSRRREMLRQVTDLFVLGASQCTDEHIALFDHIIARLAVDIEISARALLATRLAPIPNAPPGIIRKLAFDDFIEVAAPVLSQSERLDEATLVEAATIKSQEHLFAISRRSSLGEAVTDVLVERGDERVARSTAGNRGAKFSEHGLSRLIHRSEGDDELATTLGSRADIPPRIFLMLLEKASESVRAKLEAIHPHRDTEVRLVVAEVVSRIRAETLDASPDFASARASVAALRLTADLSEQKIAAFAYEDRFEEVTISLALMSNLPIDSIEQAFLKGSSETIVILTRALEFAWPTVEAILRMGPGPRLSPLKLKQFQESFERLKPATARDIVQFYQTRNVAAKTLNA